MKTYYNKMLKMNGYTISNVPARYQDGVRALGDADLASGKLPQWQYNIMFEIDEEEE